MNNCKGTKILLLLFILNTTLSFTQEKKEKSKEGWSKKGNISFLFNQSAFSDWVAGGQNNIAGNIGINYEFNYVKGNTTWNNKIIASYGLTKSKNTDFEKKTDDRFEFNSVVGIKAQNYWYYSVFVNFKTQFTKGYVYGKDINNTEVRTEYTNVMSPGYLSFGPGMLWEKNSNLKFNITPATGKLVFVNKDFTLPNGAYFGVEEGESTRFEFGLNASGYTKLNIMENVSIENILNLYANYLENVQNVDIDYTMNIVMKINKYLSTTFIFQTIYDDNAFKGFQIREVFGLGINYNF
ncbi:hypothetical protein Lupro_07795 [Lutibacter profundi]|uniref:DUF3078 domain-containing protein n=1 Tax=Lutibacter profundi TaxID=1622118 RepID=A0A0X8G6W5_9FLAO|nr:DUF3078 domain-containing protein [Lutibacter profundi]AMC11160.1 hypothetical protein Lupro_07795 [Lutibacter profundi]